MGRVLKAYFKASEETARYFKDPLRRLEYWKINQPALIVNGEGDPYNPGEDAEAIKASLPSCSLWIVSGVGHTVRFRGFFSGVRRFIEEHR